MSQDNQTFEMKYVDEYIRYVTGIHLVAIASYLLVVATSEHAMQPLKLTADYYSA